MHQNRITLAIDKRQLNRMHITFGGDSKHLEKDQNQICFKREGTLSLTLFVDVLVRIVDVVDLDHGLVPHIDSGSYREEANTGKEENNTQHGIDAMRIQK